MSLDALIMLMGAIVAVLPFLGFPNSWDSVLLLIAGALIIILGIIVRRGHYRREEPDTPERNKEEFVRSGHEA